jgi:hypothetical protein
VGVPSSYFDSGYEGILGIERPAFFSANFAARLENIVVVCSLSIGCLR